MHPKRILSTEKTSEKVVGKKENDTSSNNDNVGKGKWYTTDKTENNLTGFVAKHQLKARNGTNLLNIISKKVGTQDKIKKKSSTMNSWTS